ncbi:ribosome maturation factor RimP [Novosphingobium marinum]|uniref:Ribosome maturation factor RimP n=1 Tax=Novosphingobium marinum TaxID=1514948 RepID=A0A7Y9XYJ1_9SPHN|nr:ribosome maturation protein RimP [Novosphingobium marinum]NYH95458.1 ribosome maturation factor RimP [Novosphingobium marinum]GGC27232.1 ribosome maturation factor RimP [Novosphingobium marinum]
MADIARITQIVEPEAQALGFDLVRVVMTGSEAGDGERALQVMAERPETGQLVLDECAALSRRISDRIDALEEQGEVLVEGAYHLEVSSPGIDRPLTRRKDFEAWTGHEAKVSLAEKVDGHRNLRGDLVGIEGEVVTIDDRKAGRISFPLSAIHSAKLVLTDRLIAATRPLDTSGADEFEDEAESFEKQED